MTRGTLHLTFDDGPDPVWTPRVLKHLADAGARATFFVLGARVRTSGELVERILAEGHAVELHGDGHLDHRTAASPDLADDTDRALRTLAAHGVRPTLWRLPWGRPGPVTADLAACHGLAILGWDADSHDWRGDGWLQQPPAVSRTAQTGGVVLLHDAIGVAAPRRSCINTLELVDGLLAQAAAAGVPVRPPGLKDAA